MCIVAARVAWKSFGLLQKLFPFSHSRCIYISIELIHYLFDDLKLTRCIRFAHFCFLSIYFGMDVRIRLLFHSFIRPSIHVGVRKIATGWDFTRHWLAIISILLIVGAAGVAVPLALRVSSG